MLRFAQAFVGCGLVGAITAVYSISFAAILYNGELVAFLHLGIGMTLIGAAVMATVGGLLFSMPGTVSHPQDITAVMLAAVVAQMIVQSQIVEPDKVFATTVALVALTGLAASICVIFLGYCRMGKLVGRIPYPVMGGFLAATGYLLLTGAIGMVLERNMNLLLLTTIWNWQDLSYWAPWISIGVIYVYLTRTLNSDHVLPTSIVCTVIGFYGFLAIHPMGIEDARQAGMLLGPFPSDGLLQAYDQSILRNIDWTWLYRNIPAILSVAGMVAVGGVLNLNGLRHLTQKDVDLDRDLKAIGVVNVASAMAGGLVGYPAISTTLLGWRLRLNGSLPAVSAGMFCVALGLFGTDLLALLPKGLFAAINAFLGFDLLYSWLWTQRENLPLWDYVVVIGILLAAATIGFLQAIGLGLCASLLVRHLRMQFATSSSS